ncbi:MAG: hypothetical protein KJO50_07755, partial [Bacteroidia bacterium]|nr:hypothetical protein [Bacteroidia bacterium]
MKSISVLFFLLFTATLFGQPGFTKIYSPATIGPGSTSTLTFTITNGAGSGVENLAFTDALPAGQSIASVPNLTNSCDGTVTAPAGGTTITLSGGRVPAFGNCQISVN